MENLRIIRANTQEVLAECLRIRNAVFTLERKVPVEIEVDQWDVTGGRCDHFLAEYDGQAVGAFRCMDAGGGTLRIQRFCVLGKYRALGLGREMVLSAENCYRERGFSRVELDAKYEVCGFYEKCGYRRVSGVFEEAGIPHVKMVKELKSTN